MNVPDTMNITTSHHMKYKFALVSKYFDHV